MGPLHAFFDTEDCPARELSQYLYLLIEKLFYSALHKSNWSHMDTIKLILKKQEIRPLPEATFQTTDPASNRGS